MLKRDQGDWFKYWKAPLTTKKPLDIAKEFLERNSEEKNWKTRINTDDVYIPNSFLSLLEAGGLNLKQQKEYVRSYFLKRRSRLSPREITEKSRLITENVERLSAYIHSKRLGFYYPVRNEADTREIFSRCRAEGREAYFPRVNGTGLSYHKVSDLKELKPGKFKIPEPDSALPGIAPEDLDLILIPGVAFDDAGVRIGYGKGYYDRLLAKAGRMFLPVGGQWLDPLAVFLHKPLNSQSVRNLSPEKKKVRIAYKNTNGQVVPANAKIIWPIACAPKG